MQRFVIIQDLNLSLLHIKPVCFYQCATLPFTKLVFAFSGKIFFGIVRSYRLVRYSDNQWYAEFTAGDTLSCTYKFTSLTLVPSAILSRLIMVFDKKRHCERLIIDQSLNLSILVSRPVFFFWNSSVIVSHFARITKGPTSTFPTEPNFFIRLKPSWLISINLNYVLKKRFFHNVLLPWPCSFRWHFFYSIFRLFLFDFILFNYIQWIVYAPDYIIWHSLYLSILPDSLRVMWQQLLIYPSWDLS